MKTSEIKKKVIAIASDKLGIDNADLEENYSGSLYDHHGVDSLDMIELIMACEVEF